MAAPAGRDATSPLGLSACAAAVPVGSDGAWVWGADAGAALGTPGLVGVGLGFSGNSVLLMGGMVGCPGIGDSIGEGGEGWFWGDCAAPEGPCWASVPTENMTDTTSPVHLLIPALIAAWLTAPRNLDTPHAGGSSTLSLPGNPPPLIPLFG
jgi:hypothetical protein